MDSATLLTHFANVELAAGAWPEATAMPGKTIKCKKTLGGRHSVPDPSERGWIPLHKNHNPALSFSGLGIRPHLCPPIFIPQPPRAKILATALKIAIYWKWLNVFCHTPYVTN